MSRRPIVSALTLILGALVLTACATHRPPAVTTEPPAPSAEPLPTPAPAPEPAAPTVEERRPEEPFDVTPAEGPISVSVWAEPKHLPPGGGQTQILVRVQQHGNKPVAGLEVRIKSSSGSLYSRGRLLVTDARGMTRDRLTTNGPATITVNAGGVRQELLVSVGAE